MFSVWTWQFVPHKLQFTFGISSPSFPKEITMKCSGRQHHQQKQQMIKNKRLFEQWYKYLHVWPWPFDSLWILSHSLSVYQSNFKQSVRWFVLSKWKLITFITSYWVAQCAEIRIEKNRNHLRESNKCVAFYLERFFLEIGEKTLVLFLSI